MPWDPKIHSVPTSEEFKTNRTKENASHIWQLLQQAQMTYELYEPDQLLLSASLILLLHHYLSAKLEQIDIAAIKSCSSAELIRRTFTLNICIKFMAFYFAAVQHHNNFLFSTTWCHNINFPRSCIKSSRKKNQKMIYRACHKNIKSMHKFNKQTCP